MTAATSAPTPHIAFASCTMTTRPVFPTDSKTACSSHGFNDSPTGMSLRYSLSIATRERAAMALKKCKECGNPVSTKAATCPNCGTRVPKRLRKFMWIVGGTAGALVLIPIVIMIIVVATSQNPNAHGRKPFPTASVLYKRVQTRIASGKWQSALVVSRTLIHAYPNSKEAGLAKANLSLLNKRVAKQKTIAEARKRAEKKARIRAKIASYAFDVEPGDPPGTLAKLKRAANLAAQGANCAKVINAFYIAPSDRDPGHKDQPYFVQCSKRHSQIPDAAYAVYFSNADLKAEKVKSQQQPIAKNRALLLCRQAILNKLQYPSSADFSALSAYVSDTGTTNREVMLNFTALNGLGNRIPQRGKCYVGPHGHTEVIKIMNR